MHHDIHKKLIKRMVLWCSILSLAIGIIVALIEIERIDQYVIDLAKVESTLLTDSYHTFFHAPNPDNKIELEKLASRSGDSFHFVLVEIYNQEKQKLVEHSLEQIEPILDVLEGMQHDFLMGDTTDYVRILHDKHLYLKIITPIFDTEEPIKIIGYFEGIYQVPTNTMREMALRLFWSVAQVILAILLTSIILYPVIIALNKDLINRSAELSSANLGILKALGGAVAKRDSDTHAHNFRVTIYSICLAKKIGLNRKDLQALIKGAFLHDIGKIGISDSILLKPGKLSSEEFDAMKQHVRHGIDIITHHSWLNDAADVVRYHHEKFDGSGYTEGLRGNDIPKNARIFAIADVFDALTSDRPYKRAFSFEKSTEILIEETGNHFDPDIIKIFLEIARPLYEKISGNEDDEYLNSLLDELLKKYFD